MTPLAAAFEALFAFFLLVLERTGAAAKLASLEVPMAPDVRAAWAVVAAASVVLLLWAALASGPDVGVKTFRAAALVLSVSLPVAALRLVPTPRYAVFGGAVLAILLVAGLLHRGLAGRRKPGTASRAIQKVRLGIEAAGFLLFAAAAGLLLAGRGVPAALAFWALFLLRLSVADLIDPSNLAAEAGLKASAARDLKAAVGAGKRRKPAAAKRVARIASGLLKTALLLLWLALPLLSAVAPEEVRRGEWPKEAAMLALYPAFALALTGLVLVVRAAGAARRAPLEALRGLVAGVATGLWLFFAFRDPAFDTYRRKLPGLYAVETVAAFLLGAAGRRG